MTSFSYALPNHVYLVQGDFALLDWGVPIDLPPNWSTNATVEMKIVDDRGIKSLKVMRLQAGVTT